MTPVLHIDDEVQFSKQDTYRLFDIIIFNRNSILTCHFVWRSNFHSALYTTRSLKNYFADEPPVHYNDILGKVSNYNLNNLTKLKILALNIFRGTL